MKIRTWSPLQSGDIIDIVSPGFSADMAQIKKSMQVIRERGFVPRLPKETNGKDILCCNTDEMRLKLLIRALKAHDSKAIWCMRGGYGAIRLLSGLEKLSRPSLVKPILGLSDNTILQSFVLETWGWPSLHGPNFERLGRGVIKPSHMNELFDILSGEKTKMEIRSLKPLNRAARSRKSTSGLLKGGNLITVQGQIELPGEIDARGSILFLEDIGERGYRVDRALYLFEKWGWLKHARAVVFGEFSGAEEPGGRPSRVPAVLRRMAERVSIPVVAGFPLGHGIKQRPLALGAKATLHGGSSPWIEYATGCK